MITSHCFYDFETCNNYDFQSKSFLNLSTEKKNYIIAHKTTPLELSYSFDKNFEKVQLKTIPIKFEKSLDDCSKEEIDSLIFYFSHKFQKPITKIVLLDLIKNHNKSALSIEETFLRFVIDIYSYFKKTSFLLCGYNSLKFDNLILSKFLQEFTPFAEEYILENSFDVLDFIRQMSKSKDISFDLRVNFKFPRNNLETVFRQLYSTQNLDFHQSSSDVKATLKIYFYYWQRGFEFYFEKILFNQNNCVTSSDFKEGNKL